MDRVGWSGENGPSPGYLQSVHHLAIPFHSANGEFLGRVPSQRRPGLLVRQWSSWCGPCYTCICGWMRFHVLSLTLSQFIVFNGLQLILDINAVESGNIATDDLLLDLIGEIHSIFGFQVFWELESHEIVEEPVRIPDGEVGSPDN